MTLLDLFFSCFDKISAVKNMNAASEWINSETLALNFCIFSPVQVQEMGSSH